MEPRSSIARPARCGAFPPPDGEHPPSGAAWWRSWIAQNGSDAPPHRGRPH